VKIEWRSIGGYKQVKVMFDNTVIDLGLMGGDELENFAEHLRQTADELCPKEA